MEKDCTLKVERPVYEQEELHRTCGYSKPRSTGKYHIPTTRPGPTNNKYINPAKSFMAKTGNLRSLQICNGTRIVEKVTFEILTAVAM
jgi:hypothetical protein